MYVYVYIYMCVYVYVYMFLCVHMCVHVCVCVCVYCLIVLCAIGDSVPYSESGLCVVQVQFSVNKLMHRSCFKGLCMITKLSR